jgi:large subunit ribosomal protein L25
MPAVISRAGGAALEVTANLDELAQAVRKSGIGGVMRLVDEAANQEHLGILKELQWHPVKRNITHASFQAVDQSQVVETRIPVILQGEPKDVTRKTAQLLKQHETVGLHARVTDLPAAVAIDISDLQVGDTVTAGDVVLPAGCEPSNPAEILFQVAHAFEQQIEAPAPVEEESAEPELITKKPAEAEAE